MHRLCRFQRRAVYFLKGRWRISPVTAADPLRTRRVGASDLSKGMSFIHLDRNLEQMLIPITCAYGKSNPDIFVMQSAEDRAAKNTPCPHYGGR